MTPGRNTRQYVRGAELDVSELLALGDVVAGGDAGADDAGGDARHADRDEGDEA